MKTVTELFDEAEQTYIDITEQVFDDAYGEDTLENYRKFVNISSMYDHSAHLLLTNGE